MSTIHHKTLRRLTTTLEQAIVRFSELFALIPESDPLAPQLKELIENIERLYGSVVTRD